MIALNPGYNAARWTGEPQVIRALTWEPLINRVYTRNPTTGLGFIGYTKGDLFPNLTTLQPGVDYLIDMLGAYEVMRAVSSPAGAFQAFDGYVPVENETTTQPPVTTPTGPGFIATAIAAVDISAGMLVGRELAGLVPYSARTLAHQHLLFGVAINSAVAGEQVNVQRGGYVLIPGYGLPTEGVLFAGDEGRLVSNNIGMAFSQVVGRALNSDSFVYQPESVMLLVPNNLSLSNNGNS